MMIELLVSLVAGLPETTSPTVQDIVISERPRPLLYELELRVKCGDDAYLISIEIQGRSTSNLLASTKNGLNFDFYSSDGAMSSAINEMAVKDIVPIMCDSKTGRIALSVAGYDPQLDGIEGETGEVTLTFAPMTEP